MADDRRNPFEGAEELRWGAPRESVFDSLPNVLPDWLPDQETINRRLQDFLPGSKIRQRQQAAGVPREGQLNSLTYHALNMPGYITGLAVNAPYLPRMAEQGLHNLFRGAQLYEPGRQGRMDEQFAERVLDANIYGQAASPFAKVPSGALRSGMARGDVPAPPAYERKLDESGHFSPLVESLSKEDKKRPKNGTPQQWRNYLQKQGVKKEEMRWTGMDKWLDEQDPNQKIALADIAKEAEGRRVELKRGINEGAFDEEYWRDRMYDDVYGEYSVAPSKEFVEGYKERFEIEEVVDPDTGEKAYKLVDLDDDEWDYGSTFASRKEAEAELDDYATETAKDVGEWAVYRGDEEIQGGYRSDNAAQDSIWEHVQYDLEDMSPQEYARSQGGNAGGTTTSEYLTDRPESPFEDDYRETFFAVGQDTLGRGGPGKSWYNTHIESPFGMNETGWTLSDVYYDAATGQKGTMAHEVQSDWAQRGRKSGWANASPEDIKRLEDQKEAAWAEYKALPETVEFNGEFYTGLRPGDADAVRRLEDHIRRARDRMTTSQDPLEQQSAAQNLAARQQEINNILNGDGVTAVPAETAEQINATRKAAELRFNEADSAHRTATSGAPEGPFVTDKSGPWRQIIGGDLYRAAERGDDWYAIANPADRWGQHLDEFYKGAVPSTLKKLARQHNPQAEIETFYPTDDRRPQTPFVYTEGDPNQMTLPGIDLEQVGPRLDNDPRSALEAPSRFETTTDVGDVVMRPRAADGSYQVGSYNLQEAEPRYFITRPGEGSSFTNAVGHAFRSRDAAENAAASLKRDQAEGNRAPFDPSNWPEESTHRGLGVRLTPEMRESILKKGFPIFSKVNGAMPFVMGQWQASPEEPFRESEPLTWNLP